MLGVRVLTALVLAPLFILALFLLSPAPFAVFIGVFLLLAAWEWGGLCGFAAPGRAGLGVVLVVLATVSWRLGLLVELVALGCAVWAAATLAVVTFPSGRPWLARRGVRVAVGLLVLLPAWSGLVLLQARVGGAWLVVWTMAVVWAADIGAYFAGRAYGRHKLAPAVSPGKTIEGLLGGLGAAVVVSLLLMLAADVGTQASLPLWSVAALAATGLLVAAAVVGDLTESLFKRIAGVKDSGRLLPGHGGVLDRVDAVLAAAPVAAVLIIVLDVRPEGWLASWP